MDVEPLLPGQTLMVIRRPNSDVGELVVGDEGVDYVFWENIKKITGNIVIDSTKVFLESNLDKKENIKLISKSSNEIKSTLLN